MEIEITANDVVDAIILELQKIFGDDYKYYPENIGQGMELPCFFVRKIKRKRKKISWYKI